MNFRDFQELEIKYSVEDIKVNGIQIWPMLRIYIASQLVFEQDRSIKLNKSVVVSGLKYFFYGFRHLFQKSDYLFLSSSDQRKKVGENYIDRADIVSEKLSKVLIMELPSNGMHIPKRQCPESRIMSKYPLYFVTLLRSKFIFSVKLEGEQILKKLLEETGVSIPYKMRIRKFLAERSVMHLLIRIKNLKALLLITPYTNMGYVYAFKEKGKKVIEFQHGTISPSHYAYNLNKKYDTNLFPDTLLTFGRKEMDVFVQDNFYIEQKDVIPVGSFIIDVILEARPVDLKFKEMTQNFKKIVAYTAQDALEKQFIPFLKEAAGLDSSIGYVLIPRFRDEAYYKTFNFPDNVIYMPWLTTYEAMYLSDFHATINSTTAIEAPSLGTMNVLANVENRAVSYFKDFLDDRVCIYCDDAVSFVNAIKNNTPLSKDIVASFNSEIIVQGFRKNIDVLQKILLE